MAYGARALRSRSFRCRQRTGKPSTRAERSQRSPLAKESRFPSGKDATVREMRRAETILNIIPCHGVDPGEGNKGNWRAGCGESRTSGSEGGREKRRPSRNLSRKGCVPIRGAMCRMNFCRRFSWRPPSCGPSHATVPMMPCLLERLACNRPRRPACSGVPKPYATSSQATASTPSQTRGTFPLPRGAKGSIVLPTLGSRALRSVPAPVDRRK